MKALLLLFFLLPALPGTDDASIIKKATNQVEAGKYEKALETLDGVSDWSKLDFDYLQLNARIYDSLGMTYNALSYYEGVIMHWSASPGVLERALYLRAKIALTDSAEKASLEAMKGCEECKGKGYVKAIARCHICRGLGVVSAPCAYCGGSLSQTCTLCSGGGTLGGDGGSLQVRNCTKCGGLGSFNCTHCNDGKSLGKCPECSGEGKTLIAKRCDLH